MAACGQNRGRSGSDCRCEGCGGLHEQPLPLPALRLISPARPEYEEEPEKTALPDAPDAAECHQDEFTSHDQVLAEAEDLVFLNDLDIELSDEQLEAFCPGLSKDIGELLTEETPLLDEKARPDRRERIPHRRKVAVFMGRCHKCGGYMANDRERQFSEKDEEVYRCFTCGWRVSPVYAFNRANPGKAR
jgi:hypothetical protein